MKRKYYLIDTENVGDRWFKLLKKISKRDLIVTFYMEHHSKNLDVTRAEEAYKIIQSHNRKNLKAIREDFDKRFGKKPPQKYFKVLRPLVRVIKGK